MMSIREEGGGGACSVGFSRWSIAFSLNSGRPYIYEPNPVSILTYSSGQGSSSGSISSL
jgi:hypothetical protein